VNFDGLVGAGIVAALFRDHPIGIVPTTAYDTLLKGHRSVEELESLMTRLFGVQFGSRGTLERDYYVLLAQGAIQFRRSLVELVRRRQVELDLVTTTELILEERPGSLRMSSRYVTREIEFQALFFDSPEDATSVARSWAKDISDAIFSDPRHRTYFHLAFGIAQKYWEAYRSKDLLERQELAFLAKQYFNQESWPSKKALHRRFVKLVKKFQVDKNKLSAWKGILVLGEDHAKAGNRKGSWSEKERQCFSKYGEILGLTPDWNIKAHIPFKPKPYSETMPGVDVTWEFTDLKKAPEPVAWLAMWMLALRLQVLVNKSALVLLEEAQTNRSGSQSS
jgi:hypothetical protein